MLEMITLHTHTRSKTFTRLVDDRGYNMLVTIAPRLNQALFIIVNVLDVCMINTFLHDRPYLILG